MTDTMLVLALVIVLIIAKIVAEESECSGGKRGGGK